MNRTVLYLNVFAVGVDGGAVAKREERKVKLEPRGCLVVVNQEHIDRAAVSALRAPEREQRRGWGHRLPSACRFGSWRLAWSCLNFSYHLLARRRFTAHGLVLCLLLLRRFSVEHPDVRVAHSVLRYRPCFVRADHLRVMIEILCIFKQVSLVTFV